jgi:hypothetical protein
MPVRRSTSFSDSTSAATVMPLKNSVLDRETTEKTLQSAVGSPRDADFLFFGNFLQDFVDPRLPPRTGSLEILKNGR